MSVPDHTPTPGDDQVPAYSTPARLYGALGEGRDHFKIDDVNAATLDEAMPGMRLIVPDNRACLRRMVATAADKRLSQFIDLGSGLPDQPPNLHEIAQRTMPGAHFVYVDRDPLVCTHGRALLAAEHVAMVEADVRDVDDMLSRFEVRILLDWRQPTCVVLGAVLHFLTTDEVHALLAGLHDWLAPGSMLLLTHATSDQPGYSAHQVNTARRQYEEMTGQRLYLRTTEEITGLLLGCTPLPPGLVPTAAWHPDLQPTDFPPAPYFLAVAAAIPTVDDQRTQLLRCAAEGTAS